MFELTRRFPFGSMFQMHRELDDLVGRFLGHETDPATYRTETEPTWWPAVESYAKGGDLHVRVALPGVDPKDVEVTVSDDCLTIRGERKSKTEEKDGGRYVREFAYGSFERTLAIPEGIDPGKVQAKFGNGMLDLTMPAPVAVVPKKVEIQIEDGAGQAKAIKGA
ncbi:MAG TPA: Hsp20/alpha crystallin family protein [Methylomirabilota bacterium]|jgi:HSP20 family protein